MGPSAEPSPIPIDRIAAGLWICPHLKIYLKLRSFFYRKSRLPTNWVCILTEAIGKWGACPPVVEVV